MARAKRTDRTEARRRYRAEQAGPQADPLDGDDAEELAAPAVSTGRPKGSAPSSGSASPAARPQRPSFVGSAKAAYRPPNIREDLKVLPRLLIHWSVLVSAALALAGTVILLAAGSSSSADGSAAPSTIGYIGSMMLSLFVGPPPFGAALLIGFMLPRATYLVGLVFGAFASLCLTVFILAQPADKIQGLGAEYVLYAWVLGLIGTMFFTAGIAWYRRFLEYLNPNRGQRASSQKKAPPQGRGNAPRNRLSGSSR